MIEEFLACIGLHVPQHARLMLCQFRGDPNHEFPGKWRAKVLNDAAIIDPRANVYACISAMQKNARGEFRRRKENFAGGLLLMIDDIGDGPAAKFPMSVLDPLPPTAMVETSRGNFQAIYAFDRLVTDMAQFEALIRGFIEKQFLGKDTGMAGVNRVFRLPAGVNGKPKHEGWQVRLAEFWPERRYSPEVVREAFGIPERPHGGRVPRGATVDRAEAIRNFILVRQQLREAGMLKSREPDYGGWMQIVCPWVSNHTNSADNGAAIRIPHEDNGYHGAFRCHHGGCQSKAWRDLTQWLAEANADLLAEINAAAGDLSDYEVNS